MLAQKVQLPSLDQQFTAVVVTGLQTPTRMY